VPDLCHVGSLCNRLICRWRLAIVIPMVALVVLATTKSSHAEVSQRDLQNYCARKGSGGYTYCVAYLAGAIEMLRMLKDTSTDFKSICIPRIELNPDARRKMYYEWTLRNNSGLSSPAVSAIIRALSDQYACNADTDPTVNNNE